MFFCDIDAAASGGVESCQGRRLLACCRQITTFFLHAQDPFTMPFAGEHLDLRNVGVECHEIILACRSNGLTTIAENMSVYLTTFSGASAGWTYFDDCRSIKAYQLRATASERTRCYPCTQSRRPSFAARHVGRRAW